MMRKNRKFTPRLLDKWEFETERSKGTYGNYKPWHQITRSDPSSRGRSHLAFCPRTKRSRHHLSDGEHLMYGFALMTPFVIDIREQFKLEHYSHQSVLSDYSIHSAKFIASGTAEIADQLEIRHPEVRDNKVKALWRLSTDLLLTIQKPQEPPRLIAVAYKPIEDILNPRKRDLLRLEQAYWQQEGAGWLLITPQQFKKTVADTVKAVLPWVDHPVQHAMELKKHCAAVVMQLNGRCLPEVYKIIAHELGVEVNEVAPLFYQTVWTGLIPLDFTRSKLISEPLRLLSADEFREQNPIASGRSLWH